MTKTVKHTHGPSYSDDLIPSNDGLFCFPGGDYGGAADTTAAADDDNECRSVH